MLAPLLDLTVVDLRSNNRTRKGQLVATALSGSWRATQLSPVGLSACHLDEVAPLLYGSGAAALGWWRLRSTDLAQTESGEVLHQAYRLQALQSAIHEQKIEKLFRLLRQASVNAIVAKGWSAARLYPDSALRPYGDIDILVHPSDFTTAEDVLKSPEARDCWVDLHHSFEEIDERKVEQLFSRSTLISLNQEMIRVLSAEDHLALLCVHMLKHGAWRPLWLCDIGAAVESLSPEFAWDVCLGTNARRANWITSALGLARRLLQADISLTPLATEAMSLPTWLEENVLKQWAAPFAINQPPMNHTAPMITYLRNPSGVVRALKERWPNPILATISINGELNDFPRFPYQIGNCVMRAARFLKL
ncbi:MAG TPA: nucleotidyltransferase family protein [Pyrinomonadaceae bacterium]